MGKFAVTARGVYNFIVRHTDIAIEEIKLDGAVVSVLVPVEKAYGLNEMLWEEFIQPDIRLGTTSKVGHLLFVIVEREEK